MLNVSVTAAVFGACDDQADLPDVRLRLVSERLPAREIIARAVEAQVHTLRERQTKGDRVRRQLARQYLSVSEIDRLADEGKVALPTSADEGPHQDDEVERALAAFGERAYKMFVDGSEVKELDEMCLLREGTTINFVRLLPLVGG